MKHWIPSSHGRRNHLFGARRLLWTALLIAALIAPPALAQGKPVKLTLWSHHRHMTALTKRLVNEFNRTVGREKAITVSVRILGDDSWPTFHAAQRLGEGPDLFSAGYITGYPDPVKAGAVTWFDEFPGFSRWKSQWPSWYWIEGVTTYRGHVYAIPTQVFNSRLIYNRDLFRAIGRNPDQPPKSYGELREIARRITALRRGGYFGFAYPGAESWPVEWMPSQWAEANGDPAYWDWKQGRWALSGYLRVFQLLLDLRKDGSLFPGTEALTNDALRAQFAEGKIGMFMGEFWDVGVLNLQFPARCDWGVAPIPTYDGEFHGKSRAMMIGGSWSINGHSRHKLEAWEVVKWFTRYEVRARLYEESMCIDPDPLVVAKYVKQRPTVKGFEAFAGSLDDDYLATYPVLPDWVSPESNPCTVFRKVLIHGGDLEQSLTWLETHWNQLLDQYYRTHPEVRREWNIYPQFDRVSGRLGPPLLKPEFPD
jgi:multiple sugar transport system substrate-binding protein